MQVFRFSGRLSGQQMPSEITSTLFYFPLPPLRQIDFYLKSLKKFKNRTTIYDPAIPLRIVDLKELKSGSGREIGAPWLTAYSQQPNTETTSTSIDE